MTGITFYGLAYSQNELIDYAKKSNNTFVPFVVLDGVDEEGLFGYKLTNYNTVSIADMKYTGSALTPTITATFSDTAVAPRELAVGNGLESVTYKDARGQTVDQITGIGTYTATIKGDGNGVLGTKTVSFSVDSAVASNFTDVKAEIGAKGIDNVWYVTDGWLDYVVANGLMSGYTDGSNDFGPVDSITRGQVATILYRYECSKDSTLEAKYGSTYDTKGRSYATTTVFSDEESGAYYTAAVNWAKDAGILTGDSSTGYKTVRPNDAVQRQELCVILARFAQKVEGASTAEGTVDYSGIQGMDQVASWANTGVRWCASYGIIGGVNIDGTYHMNPSDSTWRASMAKMITVTLRDVIK